MENMTLYQRILESNLINFIIMVSILTAIFKKFKLGSIIDKMAKDIKEKVVTSSKAAQDALSEYREIKKSTSLVELDKRKITNAAKKNVQNLEEKTRLEIQQEEKNLDEKLNKVIMTNIQKTKDSTVNDVYKAIIEEAKNSIEKNLDTNTQKYLVEKSINELDTIGEIKL